MYKGKLDSTNYELESFDVITYIKVIEHINNLMDEIKNVVSL